MVQHALWWAQLGVPVFPCHAWGDGCTCGRPDCHSPGKHPRTRRGVHEATTDQGQILRWWRTWPEASIGGAIGGAGLWVLDLDGEAGIARWHRWLQETGTECPPTLTVRTGGGGLHLWWRTPAERAIRNRVRILACVDVRASGGYVILPPSTHRSGRRYEIEIDAPPADPPAALLELVAPPPPPPPPRPHPRAWYADGGRALRLRDPGERHELARRLGATISSDGTSARRIRCPQCGRPSAWFVVQPDRWYGAACAHRTTCGWSGPLTMLETP